MQNKDFFAKSAKFSSLTFNAKYVQIVMSKSSGKPKHTYTHKDRQTTVTEAAYAPRVN